MVNKIFFNKFNIIHLFGEYNYASDPVWRN